MRDRKIEYKKPVDYFIGFFQIMVFAPVMTYLTYPFILIFAVCKNVSRVCCRRKEKRLGRVLLDEDGVIRKYLATRSLFFTVLNQSMIEATLRFARLLQFQREHKKLKENKQFTAQILSIQFIEDMNIGSFENEIDALFFAIDYDNSGYLNKKEYEHFLDNFYQLATSQRKNSIQKKENRLKEAVKKALEEQKSSNKLLSKTKKANDAENKTKGTEGVNSEQEKAEQKS